MLLKPVNEKETIKAARKKLREYQKWRVIACDSAEQNITQVLTFMPRSSNGPSRPVETLALRRVEALNELEEIEQAVSRLFDTDYRDILIHKYLMPGNPPHRVIADDLAMSDSAYFRKFNNALLAFAESYRDNALVVLSDDSI